MVRACARLCDAFMHCGHTRLPSPPLPLVVCARWHCLFACTTVLVVCVASVLLLRCLFSYTTLHGVVTIDACRLRVDAGGWPCFGACSTPLRTAAGCRHRKYATWVVGWWCFARAIACACMRVCTCNGVLQLVNPFVETHTVGCWWCNLVVCVGCACDIAVTTWRSLCVCVGRLQIMTTWALRLCRRLWTHCRMRACRG